jgi:DNA replication and repair protein RecF
LSLVNFRNYEGLELDLGPGMVLFQGRNGQGKSNLLEAIYILAVAKSPRASSDRELIRWQAAQLEETYSRVAATVAHDGEQMKVQLDFRSVPAQDAEAPEDDAASRRGPESISTQKYIRVNGVPRRASELVGQVNAVMFSAEDLELVHGPPPVRRRYLDILVSQLDRRYLRALQRYQRVVYQRNHLLRMVRDGSARADELDFWDNELTSEGVYIMAQRLRTVRRLSDVADPIHQGLTGDGEKLKLLYRPSVFAAADSSDEALAQRIRRAVESRRRRDVAQGITTLGPHRDDVQLLLNDMDASAYASRGQGRTMVVAMKLAEAQYLKDERKQEPVLLLDDVLSELDAARRSYVLEAVGRYQQCFITTAEVEQIEARFLLQMSRFVVEGGRVEAANVSTSGESSSIG